MGGTGGTVANDEKGRPVSFTTWMQTHKDNDRELVQGIKGDPYYLITKPDGVANFALNAICTHLGCCVPWSKALNKFCCPCHGSQYDDTGKVIRGPAPLSLALAHTKVEDDSVLISAWPEKDFRTDLDPWWV